MTAKFLIIDDNAKYRSKLKRLLLAQWPDAEVEQFDPVTDGWPGETLQWFEYDLLFLDYVLKQDSGLEWFEILKSYSGFPPTIIVSTQSDPEVAVKVIKSGAENYIPKSSLTRKKLASVVQEILSQPGRCWSSSPQPKQSPADDPINKEVEQVLAAEGSAPNDAKVVRLKKRHKEDRRNWPDIDGHSIIKKVGQGGMSTVYLAERQRDSKRVVVKTLSVGLVDNKKSVARSNQEFKLISRIKNPHIVSLYEQGMIGDVLFTTMEHFSSGDLKQRLRKGITQKQAISYLKQIAEGLKAIHGCGIIHRDLKPANIMFRDDDSLAIIDFGISKDINSQMDLTIPGQVMGTPNYMAPEQGSNTYKPDARSDIYSLGVLLYEMLTGKKPYAAPTGAAIIYKHLHDPIPQLPNQFYEMQVLVDKMMAKFPHQRFQSAYDLIKFIESEFRWDITLDFA